MPKFSVDFFREEDGTKPVGVFIRSLDVKLKVKVVADLHLLGEFGNMARGPLSKHLGDDIFEIRSKVGSDIVRILYFFDGNRIIIATNEKSFSAGSLSELSTRTLIFVAAMAYSFCL